MRSGDERKAPWNQATQTDEMENVKKWPRHRPTRHQPDKEVDKPKQPTQPEGDMGKTSDLTARTRPEKPRRRGQIDPTTSEENTSQANV